VRFSITPMRVLSSQTSIVEHVLSESSLLPSAAMVFGERDAPADVDRIESIETSGFWQICRGCRARVRLMI
jgi:hypothetical protein